MECWLLSPGNRRPSLVSLAGATGLHIHDITLRSGACFQLFVEKSSQVVIEELTIAAGCGFKQAPNTDGIHLQSVRDASVRDSSITNGDDCVVVSGDSSDVHVQRVHCRCSAGAAVVMPWATSSGHNIIDGVSFVDIVAFNTSHCAGIKSEAQYTGAVSNVRFENIACTMTSWFAFYVNPFNQSGAQLEPGAFSAENVTWQNTSVAVTGDPNPGHFWCAPGQCRGLQSDNVQVTGTSKQYLCDGAQVSGNSVDSAPRACFAAPLKAGMRCFRWKHR